MKNLSQHKHQLAGYEDVRETVRVLEKVAAGHLHKLQQTAESLSQYTETMLDLMHRLEVLAGRPLFVGAVPQSIEHDKELLLVLTGDKGLVSDLWHRLYELYNEQYKDLPVELLVVGARGQLLWPEGGKHKVSHYSFTERLPTHEELLELSSILFKAVSSDLFSSVSVLYVEAVSLTTHIPTVTTLLPLSPQAELSKQIVRSNSIGFPIIDASYEELASDLLQKYLINRLEQLVMEVALSEFSARTIGLEHAGAKTDDIIKKTVRQYRRRRRHADTQKQLERFSATRTS